MGNVFSTIISYCRQAALIFGSIVLLFCLWGVQLSTTTDTSQLIRLHVLANSDSAADQALKLEVKNQVVAYMQQEFAGIDDVTLGRAVLLNQLDNIEAVAVQALTQADSPYPVHLEYGHFDFPVKYYGSFSLPAGNYEALRIIIGDGQGSNWWCVLFPPMCFVDSNQVDSGQYSQLTPQKTITFKWRTTELLECIKEGAEPDETDTAAEHP